MRHPRRETAHRQRDYSNIRLNFSDICDADGNCLCLLTSNPAKEADCSARSSLVSAIFCRELYSRPYSGFRCTWLIMRKCGLFSLSPNFNVLYRDKSGSCSYSTIEVTFSLNFAYAQTENSNMLKRLVTILILLAAVGFASADSDDEQVVTVVDSGESKLPATSVKSVHKAKMQRILQENELLRVQIKNAELKRDLKEILDPPSETQDDLKTNFCKDPHLSTFRHCSRSTGGVECPARTMPRG